MRSGAAAGREARLGWRLTCASGRAIPAGPWSRPSPGRPRASSGCLGAESAVARAGLEALSGARASLRVSATDASLPLWRRVEEGRAEVLVVDLDRQAVSRTLRELARLPRPPATIFLTDDLRALRTSEARRAGVRAVLPRGATASELVAAIEAVAAGLIVLHPDGVEALLSPSS